MSTTNHPVTPTATETWLLMASLVHDHSAAWRAFVTERTGMPFSRFRALRRLEPAPLTASALAERLDVDMPATSVIVTDLVARGLVSKTSDPDYGRSKILTLTPAGSDVMADVRAHAQAPTLIQALDEQQRATLHQILSTMQEHDA